MRHNLPVEETVCTLEQAEELADIFRKAGVEPPPSVWFWGKLKEKNEWEVFLTKARTHPVYSKHFTWMEKYNAYTGDELWALFFGEISISASTFDPSLIGNYTDVTVYLTAAKESDGQSVYGYAAESWDWSDKMWRQFKGKIAAQAKADLAIQGLREGWIKPEELNYS